MLSRTSFVAFTSPRPFRFALPNASESAAQTGRAGQVYLTSIRPFIEQVLLPARGKVQLDKAPRRVRCLPVDQWRDADFLGKKLLVLLPSQALGDCVQATMALQTLYDQRGAALVSVACAGMAYDIFATNPRLDLRSLWLSQDEVASFDQVLDLGHLPAVGDIDIWPVDFEGRMIAALGVEPSPEYPARARPCRSDGKKPLSIGILPLASSPLRTLPAKVVADLVEGMAPFGEVTVCLNRNQGQGRLLAAGLASAAARWPASVRTVDVFPSIRSLLDAVRGFDYAVFADSGPAHMAKLFGTPGMAIYTSAPGAVLQGRFTNLGVYQSPFRGPHCEAPCGLAKLRRTADGRVGCMGSLGLPLAQLPETPTGSDPATVQKLTEQPVPCVADLASRTQPLLAAVAADLTSRLQ